MKKSIKVLTKAEIERLSPDEKRRLHLLPQEGAPGKVTVRGEEVIEAFLLAANPNWSRKDILLLRAKRQLKRSRRIKDAHFTNSELRGVSFFAHSPQLSDDQIRSLVFDERNFLVSSFWRAWKRDPEAVLDLTQRIREARSHPKVKQHRDVEDTLTRPEKYSCTDEGQKSAAKRARYQLKPSSNVSQFAENLRKS